MSNLSDPIADFLTRLRNGATAGKAETNAPYSKIKAEIARILKQEGYIENYEIDSTGKFPEIKVKNKLINRTAGDHWSQARQPSWSAPLCWQHRDSSCPRRHGHLHPLHSSRAHERS
jgi:hypothetical protein